MILVGSSSLGSAQNSLSIEEKIDSILPLLTLQEKLDLCHGQSKFSAAGVERLGIPELWMSDGPHGVRAEMAWDDWSHAGWTNDSITAFPALTCLAATFNPDLAYEYGRSLGEEARYRKKDVLLGPGVNIYRTPLNGRNFEYMGEDPFLASTMVVPYIHGVQQNGVAACVKHFVLNNQEKDRERINVEVSDRALHEIYLPAFKAAVNDGNVWSIMGAYNKYKDQFCCHNELLLNKILKSDWGFDGVVISDWGGAHNTRESALFGLDLEMGTGTNGLSQNSTDPYDQNYLAYPFLKGIRDGTIEEAVLDDKVRRLLRLRYRTNMSDNRPRGKMNNPEHLRTARRIATDGIVLLQNENAFFPLDSLSTMTIGVIGENATRMMTIGGGSSELKAKKEVSPLEGLQERFGNATIMHTMGYSSGRPIYGRVDPPHLDQDSLKRRALDVAKEADLVLFIGGLNKNHHQDCEGGDRLTYHLPFGQDELIKELSEANENLGVILISGNAVAMPWLSDVKGLVQGWYLGSQAGHALADILSGHVNPSGKLPFTFPTELSDNSAHHFGPSSYPGDGKVQQYVEGIFVGYRWHQSRKIEPLFPFGFGLSYTEFKLSDVEVSTRQFEMSDTIIVTYQLTNDGPVAGAEVIQVYVGKLKSEVERVPLELKGFQKTYIESGRSEELQIKVPVSALAYYDEMKADWVIEPGGYRICVGASSDELKNTIKIDVLDRK